MPELRSGTPKKKERVRSDDEFGRVHRSRTFPPPPYQEILGDLIRSTMRSLGDLQDACHDADPLEVDDVHINRHFAWLALVYPEGTNRHLFEGSPEISFPLRTDALRAPNELPETILKLLRARQPLPLQSDIGADPKIVDLVAKLKIIRAEPTRISLLIKQAFAAVVEAERKRSDVASSDHSTEDDQLFETDSINKKRAADGAILSSPLSIVCDYLTMPEMTGTRSYALLTLRNFLFENLGIFPSGLSSGPDNKSFTVQEVETALSNIWTSIRPRFWSSGQDKLPTTVRGIGGLVRHFMALNGMLWLRFKDAKERISYCKQADFFEGKPEFSKSSYLEKLPELGELVNELWGVLLPIRGASTIFRGGLKFSSRRGLVMAVHGGAGAGKTTLALALASYLAPFEIKTLFLTADESESDLRSRAEGLVADEIRRGSFFSSNSETWLKIDHYKFEGGQSILNSLRRSLRDLGDDLKFEPQEASEQKQSPKPCKAIVVLDGLHDLLIAASQADGDGQRNSQIYRLHEFIDTCRELQALVILTTGEEWAGDVALDYMVDVALRLTHESTSEYGMKPDRRLIVTKARHQLCAAGTHGIQIAGAKGVRFSPQINYQLDRRAIWKTRLPNWGFQKSILRRTCRFEDAVRFPSVEGDKVPARVRFGSSDGSVSLPRGASIFLNGKGSGGKAALALKIAIAPSFVGESSEPSNFRERILVVSFLYPDEYYHRIKDRLVALRVAEYNIPTKDLKPVLKVIQLYPGYLKPNDLFNRIEWELDEAELQGFPYTTVIVDGIHNTFLQFPELEKYRLIWAQLYASLRSRPISIITTHTTFALTGADAEDGYRLDDNRSEALRHALVQKTDFRLEIDPWEPSSDQENDGQKRPHRNRLIKREPNIFEVRTISAINQPIPSQSVLWSRERLILCEPPETLPLFSQRSDISVENAELKKRLAEATLEAIALREVLAKR